MTCNDCNHIAVCYRYSYGIPQHYADKCGDFEERRPIGQWKVHPKGVYAHLVCDKCLTNAPYDCRTNYCPNCGARMIKGGN